MSNDQTTPERAPDFVVPAAKMSALETAEISVSFEFFPPASEAAAPQLRDAITTLGAFRPEFASVTYGANGSTRNRTLETLSWMKTQTDLRAAGHLTCVGASRAETDAVAQDYARAGIRHIVALRGDAAGGAGATYEPHPAGYRNAADLVGGLRRLGDFEISVAAYPEQHPDSANLIADLDNLKAKQDAGADRAITQFFFDNADYHRFLERTAIRGITLPIIPGIMPIHDLTKVAHFAGKCGARIPAELWRRFEGVDAKSETARLIAVGIAAEQVARLIADGVRQFHFYTLNRAELSYAVCRLIGLQPALSPRPELATKAA